MLSNCGALANPQLESAESRSGSVPPFALLHRGNTLNSVALSRNQHQVLVQASRAWSHQPLPRAAQSLMEKLLIGLGWVFLVVFQS